MIWPKYSDVPITSLNDEIPSPCRHITAQFRWQVGRGQHVIDQLPNDASYPHSLLSNPLHEHHHMINPRLKRQSFWVCKCWQSFTVDAL